MNQAALRGFFCLPHACDAGLGLAAELKARAPDNTCLQLNEALSADGNIVNPLGYRC